MRILSPPRRTTITGGTFARNSEAYDSLGRIALPGLPRLEYVAGVGWVTWVEEAATNLLTANQASVETDTTGFTVGGTATIEFSIDWKKIGTYSLKISNANSSTNSVRFLTPVSVTSGLTYTYSFWVYNPNAYSITVYGKNYFIDNIVVPAQSEIRFAITRAPETSWSSINEYIHCATNDIFYVDAFQLEQKAYPTTFCLSSSPRVAESLTMPTTGLSVAEGTIEGIVEVTDVAKRQGGDNSCVFRIPGTSGQVLFYHVSTSADWYFLVSNGTSSNGGSLADSLTPNGWYLYKVYWSSSAVVIFEIWSLSTKTKVGSVSVATSFLPPAFGSYVYIGTNAGSALYLNTRFGKHRLSYTARTDDPDFDDLMPNDANTVGIFDPTPIYNQNVR